MKLASLVVFALLTAATPAVAKPKLAPPPPGAAGPEAFVRWVYGRYRLHGPKFDGQAAYSPELKALFARNTRLLHGEVGDNNEVDPVCQCQDWYTIRIARLELAPIVGGRTQANVDFVNDKSLDAVKLDLVLTPSGWRIDDIIHADPGRKDSLKASLLEENQRLARGG